MSPSEESLKRSRIDRFLIRAKDVMLLITTCVPALILVTKFWSIPGIVEAHAKDIDYLKERQIIDRTEIAVVKQGIGDIKEILYKKL